MRIICLLTIIFLCACKGNGVVNGGLMNTGTDFGGIHAKNVSITQGYIEVDIAGNIPDNNNAIHLTLRYVNQNNSYGCVLIDLSNNGNIETHAGGTETSNNFSNSVNSGFATGANLAGNTFGCEIIGGVVNAYINRVLQATYTIGANANDNATITSGSYGAGVSDGNRGTGNETVIIDAVRFYSARPF